MIHLLGRRWQIASATRRSDPTHPQRDRRTVRHPDHQASPGHPPPVAMVDVPAAAPAPDQNLPLPRAWGRFFLVSALARFFRNLTRNIRLSIRNVSIMLVTLNILRYHIRRTILLPNGCGSCLRCRFTGIPGGTRILPGWTATR